MIRVLVVDDSPVVRKVLTRALSQFADIAVVGGAADPYEAREQIAALRPSVLTLDVHMPRMDGLSFLAKLMQHYPLPVVVVCAVTPEHGHVALRALELGAVDVVAKPDALAGPGASPASPDAPDFAQHLAHAVRAAAAARVRPRHQRHARHARPAAPHATPASPGPHAPPVRPAVRPPEPAAANAALSGSYGSAYDLLAIGASTGGTRAIETVLRDLPAAAPGAVIVQHMPAPFVGAFAAHLDRAAAIAVREARDGDAIEPGVALVAPGDRHLVVQRAGSGYVARLDDGPRVRYQRPSVDVLFASVAASAGPRAIGALLTGMGADGAEGLLAMRRAGAYTLAEAEQSCVVFGMPKEAIRLGAVAEVVPLPRMAGAITAAVARAGRAGNGLALTAGRGGPNA